MDKLDLTLAWAGSVIIVLLIGFFLGHYSLLDDTGEMVVIKRVLELLERISQGRVMKSGFTGPGAIPD